MKNLFLFTALIFVFIQGQGQCLALELKIDIENINELSKKEIESLNYLREEEFLAGDVYDYLAEIYSLPVFNNIGRSEDVHTEKVRELLEAYDIVDPAENHKAGIYKNKKLQEHYDALIALGEKSLHDAIIEGLTIEEMDIKDLQEALDNVIQEENIRKVYDFLLMGSHNHLKAFNFHANNLAVNYSPQFLSPKEFKIALEKEK
ncbi:MAG: DUF2202 domain-containing protein [Bacteroidales bacterium]|nr:DUF2202 domain-containing protein [Bacteroidales bacterium]